MREFWQTQEEFRRFIDFGRVFDELTRAYLVGFLEHTLTQSPPPEIPRDSPFVKSPYFEAFMEAMLASLEAPDVQRLTQQSRKMSQQIALDLLKWLKRTDKKIQSNNPYLPEKERFDAWAHKPTHLWAKDWYVLTNFLSNTYPPEELSIDFYTQKFKALLPETQAHLQSPHYNPQAEKKIPFDLLSDALLLEWDALLAAKMLAFALQHIEEDQQAFGATLEAKARETLKLTELITPFALETGRYWDMSEGLWQETGFEVLEQYAQLLRDEQSLQELVDLLGRMREAEIETEEEEIAQTIIRKEWITDLTLKTEIGGLYRSNQLSEMIPSEAALLGHPDTESLFLQKYADHGLNAFQYQGKRLVSSSKVLQFKQQRQKRKEKGPFILCVDTSGSMHGLPAQVAKVLSFGMMKMAAQDQRKCYLISFSIGLKTLNLHDISASMDEIVKFLSMSFEAGTDATPALSEALRMLQSNDYREADVLMISDFVMYNLREDLVKRIEKERQKETKFHSLAISDQPNTDILQVFDNNWVYDPEDRRVIRHIWQEVKALVR
ncbi:MAG: VWA domain-containing protein [Bernardetiaceae bacterium]